MAKEKASKRKVEKDASLRELDKESGRVDELFLHQRLTEVIKPPTVEYLEYRHLFDTVTRHLLKAERYYITAKFPGISYTLNPDAAASRGDYVRTLWARCFEQRDLEVSYLTCLDLDYPYTHSLRVHKSRDKALKECQTILRQLETQVRRYSNFKVYYLKEPYGLDIMMTEDVGPEDIFIFTRNVQMDVTGGIHIFNRDIACRTKEWFQTLCRHAMLLDAKNYKKVIKEKNQELRQKYG